MPHGLVLLPDHPTHDRLTVLATTIAGPAPINTLGPHAPAHVSILHFTGGDPDRIRTRAATRTIKVKPIGLLYAHLAPGDYYVPQGGVYFGLELVRRPALDDLHQAALEWVKEAGAEPLGAVGDDYRPHITLGVTNQPALPDLAEVPTGEIEVTLAFGELGPYGTFPGLAPIVG
ncbi:hypothetical protein [Actinoplanes sp. N902-109]|uniref:hypothetical protein n=1 Tax=Actinoplanes sp. (strain N902-109) TaxID=649831 RepID=UPI00032968A1|nr:hypothetical protein [Actinoplanes sp. N902-109]AGL21485.1 hypothetical protein L083_7975 [Actinoplanes sp. N902-109]